ncbi:MAG: Triosephosphate isomerase [Parcubacteria group bacterium GW2011_GWA1_47_11]|uniref:Triosephosphate isomerase n=1 Tax=Candidatus Nomurabacteria bacterium GW2011_GWB1_47_6 TaxID=1618749 RepID=A0A0G1T275_9BACT|nr:MAG: Triosephosphate isomerase [Parcubacteria group bacterium GW2011_GWA1_47_11]KKU75921.1 MAG: Triosephosphate isomerase [Candidatus Nomurabacteria bacterium GW2011_GWB1_47_6]
MPNKRIVVANWKMNPLTEKEAEKLWTAVARNISALRKTEVVICPPFIYLSKIKKLSRKILLGSQDAFWGNTGAFTGEVSSEMLYLSGARYVILGHSERRARGETDADINKKIKSALDSGFRLILCVGETIRDEEHGYFNSVKDQLEAGLQGISKDSLKNIIIAYEPVWALSSTPGRRDAAPEDSSEMAIFIRKVLSDKFGREASRVKILYGGSVNDRDAEGFLTQGGVDGLLVGKASLNAEKFVNIIKISEKMG